MRSGRSARRRHHNEQLVLLPPVLHVRPLGVRQVRMVRLCRDAACVQALGRLVAEGFLDAEDDRRHGLPAGGARRERFLRALGAKGVRGGGSAPQRCSDEMQLSGAKHFSAFSARQTDAPGGL